MTSSRPSQAANSSGVWPWRDALASTGTPASSSRVTVATSPARAASRSASPRSGAGPSATNAASRIASSIITPRDAAIVVPHR